MRNNNRTIGTLDNDTGEFKKGNIERTVSRASGKQVEPPIEAERKNKTQHQTKPYMFTTSLMKDNRKRKSLLIRKCSFKSFLVSMSRIHPMPELREIGSTEQNALTKKIGDVQAVPLIFIEPGDSMVVVGLKHIIIVVSARIAAS